MQAGQLANILRRAHQDAPEKMQSTGVRLFAIKYADEIQSMKRDGISVRRLVELADIGDYTSEIGKGIILADYVGLKSDNLWF